MEIIINLKEQVSQIYDALVVQWNEKKLHIETVGGDIVDIETQTILNFNIKLKK